MYNLFLDDERLPHRVTWVNLPSGPWVVVRNYKEFCDYISMHGLPHFVTFDHDLSIEDQNKHPITGVFKEKTGMDCARWLVAYCMNNNRKFPEYEVHSMNVIGKVNIKSYVESFKSTIK